MTQKHKKVRFLTKKDPQKTHKKVIILPLRRQFSFCKEPFRTPFLTPPSFYGKLGPPENVELCFSKSLVFKEFEVLLFLLVFLFFIK